MDHEPPRWDRVRSSSLLLKAAELLAKPGLKDHHGLSPVSPVFTHYLDVAFRSVPSSPVEAVNSSSWPGDSFFPNQDCGAQGEKNL